MTENKKSIQVSLNKKTVIIGIVVLAFIIGLLFVIFKSGSQPKGDIAAKVNKEVITMKELDAAFTDLSVQAPQLTKSKVLDQLISRKLLLQEAIKKNYKVSAQEIADVKTRIENLTGQNIDDLAQQKGIAMKEVDQEIKDQLAIQKMLNETLVVDVTDEEAQKFYDSNSKLMVTPASRNVSHILSKTEDEAKAIIAELDQGADFTQLAFEKSTDPSAKKNQGNLGFITKGQMVPSFETAAFSQELGKYSKEPIKSPFGYHVILVHDEKPEEKLKFDDVKKTIKSLILTQKQQQALQKLLAQLRTSAKIEIFYKEENDNTNTQPQLKLPPIDQGAQPTDQPADQQANPDQQAAN